MSLLMPTTTHHRPDTRPTSERWAEVHARSQAVHDLVEDVRRRGPRAAQRVRPPFVDQADQARALHEHWSRRLACRLDMALETGSLRPDLAAREAWRATDADLPGVRSVLDRAGEEDVVRRMDALDHRAMAVAAGLSAWDAPLAASAAVGRRLTRG